MWKLFRSDRAVWILGYHGSPQPPSCSASEVNWSLYQCNLGFFHHKNKQLLGDFQNQFWANWSYSFLTAVWSYIVHYIIKIHCILNLSNMLKDLQVWTTWKTGIIWRRPSKAVLVELKRALRITFSWCNLCEKNTSKCI